MLGGRAETGFLFRQVLAKVVKVEEDKENL